MELLEEKEAVTYYNDPYIPQIKPTRKYKQFAGKKKCGTKKNQPIRLRSNFN